MTRTTRRHTVLWSAVVVVGMSGAAARSAGATPVLDQQQSSVDLVEGWLAIGGGSEQMLAQVLTAGISGELTEIRIPVGCSSGYLVLQVQGVTGDTPNGVVLASETISGASFPPTPDFKTVLLSHPPFVVAGTRVALVLSATIDCGIPQGPVGDPYGPGDGYYDARPSPPGWLPLGERRDLPFQTFVEPRPVATVDAFTTGFNTFLTVPAPGVIANDADNGGGALTAALVTSTSNGIVALAGDGSFTYAPNPGFLGPDTFAYRAVNTIGSSNAATVTITVSPPPPPTTVDDAFTTPFLTALSVATPGVLGNDITTPGASLTASLVGNTTNGVLALGAAGGFVYTPNADFFGTDRFTYRASNVGGPGNAAAVTLTVSNTTTLQPPRDLYAASIVGNVVTLRFRAPNAGPAPAGYVLKGGVLPGQVLASLPTGSAFPIFTLTAPTGAFHVRMHAIDSGGMESAPSNEIQIFVGVPAPPSAPADLTGLVNGASVALAWRNTYGGGTPGTSLLDVSGSVAATFPMGPGESFTVGGVPTGTYTLRLRSANAAGTSTFSNPITLEVPGGCSGAPHEPSRFLAYRVLNRLYVVWEPPTSGPAPTGYEVNVDGAFVGAFPTTGRSLDGAAGPGGYRLSARSTNACGASPPTPSQSVTVP